MPSSLFRSSVRSAVVVLFATSALSWGACAADQPVRIAFPSGMNGQIVVTMDKAKIADRVGMKAEYSAFQYGPPMMEALAAGSIDAVVTSMMPVASYAAKLPGDIKIVAIVNQGGHAVMIGKESGLTSPAQLEGKSIGVSFGSDSHLDLLLWMREIGLTGKAKLINVTPAELSVALSNASVDAIVIRQPQVLRMQQQTGARIMKEWPLQYISIARTKFIKERPEQFRQYLAALRETTLYMARNQDQSAAWFAEYLRTDPAVIREIAKQDAMANVTELSQIDLSIKPRDREMIEGRLRDAFAEKMIKEKVDPRSLFD